ncbi:MAG: type VI secretion system-associated FHA domain protein TagH [Rhodopila sp.]
MPLTLTVLRCPPAVRPERWSVRAGELSVGRGPGVDWILPDPEQTISRRHFTIVLRAGGWHIIDESSNGTFANRERAPIGRGNRRPLRNNDRIRLGPYELEATLDEDTMSSRRGGSMRGAAHRAAASDRRRDPFAEPPKSREPSIRVARPLRAPFTDGSTTLHDLTPNPSFDIPASTAQTGPANDDASLRGNATNLPAPSLVEIAGKAHADSALVEAFLAGLKLSDIYPVDAEAMFRRLGETYRVMVAGLRAVLVARAAMKREFRIDQTMIRARGNNPLKFAADDDDAIAAILGIGRRSDMTPASMVAEALHDITLHELASMTAMQSAAGALLAEIDPDHIRGTVERAGGVTLLPAQKKARAWDTFEALHVKLTQSLNSDFESVFSRAFAKAYEDALAELDAKEDRR